MLGGEGQPQAAQARGGELQLHPALNTADGCPARGSTGLTPDHSGCRVAAPSLVPDGGPGLAFPDRCGGCEGRGLQGLK